MKAELHCIFTLRTVPWTMGWLHYKACWVSNHQVVASFLDVDRCLWVISNSGLNIPMKIGPDFVHYLSVPWHHRNMSVIAHFRRTVSTGNAGKIYLFQNKVCRVHARVVALLSAGWRAASREDWRATTETVGKIAFGSDFL